MAVGNSLNISDDGVVVNNAGTFAARTLSAGSTKISITNGDGTGGNPTFDAVEANFTLDNIGGTLATTKGGTGLTSYTTGDVLYASGANTLSNLSIGSAGEILTVSGGLPSWEAAGAGAGAWVFLSSGIVSTTTSVVTFQDLFSATYDTYAFVINNFTKDSLTADLLMQFSTDSGSSWATSGYESGGAFYTSTSDARFKDVTTSGMFATYDTLTGAVGQGCMTIFLHSPFDSSAETQAHGKGTMVNSTGEVLDMTIFGNRGSATEDDSVRFLMTTGNIETVEIYAYGIKKA